VEIGGDGWKNISRLLLVKSEPSFFPPLWSFAEFVVLLSLGFFPLPEEKKKRRKERTTGEKRSRLNIQASLEQGLDEPGEEDKTSGGRREKKKDRVEGFVERSEAGARHLRKVYGSGS